MYHQRKIRSSVVAVIIFIVVIMLGWYYRTDIRVWWEERNDESVPVAVEKEDILDTIGPHNTNTKAAEPEPEPEPLPAEFNLSVPFTTQAPQANWNLPYQEACEEASAAIVHYYWADKSFDTPEIADAEILALVDFQTTTYGSYLDTTAEETARFIRDYYGYKTVDVIYDPTIEQIKREVFSGYPVIVPAYGKVLDNPNFRSGGPLYHMLVIKGYTTERWITNDPGTRKGADFTYTYDNLMNAMGDWNDGDPANGRPVMIVVRD
ncbi:MAG: C39 family peptidase [Patescibacteria group bacterium]